MAAKIYFPIVETHEPDAKVVIIEDGTVFQGTDPDENLACGQCKYVFGRSLSTRRFVAEVLKDIKHQVVLKCHCGALNLIKSKPASSG